MTWKHIASQYLQHLPAYATDSVKTWRDIVTRLPKYGLKLDSIRLLEVGCGYAYPYIVLFDSVGADVVGIDIQPLSRREIRLDRYAGMLRARGVLPTVRRVARDLAFHLAFDRALGRAAALPIRQRHTKLVRMDGARMGFEDASFDFVYSSACFEHLEDVPIVAAEIARVLKPDGMAEIEVHLFTSMTGGHEPELYDRRLPPPHFRLWGHLLDPSWEAPVFLNRWRDQQFHDVFARHFNVRERRVTSGHGRQYLTPEIISQLTPTYSLDELATESLLYILSPRIEAV